MPLGAFSGVLRANSDLPLGRRLAEVYALQASMKASGFDGSQISRNWRDLADEEKKLKRQMTDRHIAALKLTENGDREGAIEHHRANYVDLFHVAATYEILAMAAQEKHKFDDAVEILEKGLSVFGELVPEESPNRAAELRFLTRRRDRMQVMRDDSGENE